MARPSASVPKGFTVLTPEHGTASIVDSIKRNAIFLVGLIHWLPVLVVNLVMFNQIKGGKAMGRCRHHGGSPSDWVDDGAFSSPQLFDTPQPEAA